MIKFPSLYSVWQQFRNVLHQFPLQAAICLFTTCVWVWSFENPAIENENQLYKLIVLCNLAFTLSLSANLYAKFNYWRPANSWILQLVALIPCAILFVLTSPEFFKADVLRIVLFIFAGHLLVSFSAYSNSENVLNFWHFNKILFLRFLTGVLFSMVLFGGLAIALLSIDTLFNYDIAGDTYFKLFIIVAVGFNTLFFLAGVPVVDNRYMTGQASGRFNEDLAFGKQRGGTSFGTHSTENTEELTSGATNIESNEIYKQRINAIQDTSYPKVLKIFTQYVLIPLLTIYLVILAVYELKILINFQLPDGMVSILILGYAVLGILSYLLIYPINKESGNEWMRQFSKLFFWLMLPLLALLFVAVWVRVAEYGLTEMRYFIIVLAIWLLGITLYFIIHKSPRIQLIPISLFIFTLLSTYGPQSAATLSKKSQQSRLSKYIDKQDKKSLDEKVSIINYLVDFHGLTALQAFTPAKLSNIQKDIIFNTDSLKTGTYVIKNNLRDTAFSILSIDANSYNNASLYINFINEDEFLSNDGFDYAYWLQNSYKGELNSPFGKIIIKPMPNEELSIKIGESDSVRFDMSAFEQRLFKEFQGSTAKATNSNSRVDKNNNVPIRAELMKLSSSSEDYKVEIRVQSMTVSKTDDEKKYPSSFTGYLLISEK